MTTKVIVSNLGPDDVNVSVVSANTEGEVLQGAERVAAFTNSYPQYVHSGQRIVVTEVPREVAA